MVPVPSPSKNPYPRYNKEIDLCEIPTEVIHNPDINKIVPTMDDIFMFFSTIFPKKAAPIPRKNIPNENENCTAFAAIPVYDDISVAKLVKAYICPTDADRRNAGRIE